MIYEEFITGEHIRLRAVGEDDAEFIVKIRTDEKYNRFLHKTDPDVQKQKLWIQSQRTRMGDYYFIIESPEGTPIGTISLYNIDLTKNEGEMGRWICVWSAVESLESIIRLYDFGFSILHLERIITRTLECNIKVLNFHKSFGASFLDRDDFDPILHQRFVKQGILKKDYEVIRNRNLLLLKKMGLRGSR